MFCTLRFLRFYKALQQIITTRPFCRLLQGRVRPLCTGFTRLAFPRFGSLCVRRAKWLRVHTRGGIPQALPHQDSLHEHRPFGIVCLVQLDRIRSGGCQWDRATACMAMRAEGPAASVEVILQRVSDGSDTRASLPLAHTRGDTMHGVFCDGLQFLVRGLSKTVRSIVPETSWQYTCMM